MLNHERFMVIRQDDHGVQYVVADNLTDQEAVILVDLLSARGHKQMFFSCSWTTKEQRNEIVNKM